MGHSIFLGSTTPEPETVTTFFTTGIPVVIALKMAQVVLILNTAQPMLLGSPPGGTCLPVMAWQSCFSPPWG